MNDLTTDLMQAAGRWAFRTVEQWREQRPNEYQQFKQLFDAGAAGTRVVVTIGPEPKPQIEFFGIVDGQQVLIGSQTVTVVDGSMFH